MAPKVRPFDGEIRLVLDKFFPSFKQNPLLMIDDTCLQEGYIQMANEIENLEVYDDDVWVCSFPKCGTTWTQEMVWNIANGVDLERAKVLLQERFPFLECSSMFLLPETCDRKTANDDEHVALDTPDIPSFFFDSLKFTKNQPRPRFIKTHLHYHLLPKQIRTGEKKPKIIYVARNAKDTCVSYYYHSKIFFNCKATLEEFCDFFLDDKLISAPYFSHVLGYWEKRDKDNILFLKYEDMKTDLMSVIKQTANFLEKKLSDEQIATLGKHLHFSNMKSNKAVNYETIVDSVQKVYDIKSKGNFIRSGKNEQWKDELTADTIKRFDSWIDENLKGTGLSF